MALFPADVFPLAEDTADTLAARLGGCDFLDDIHFKKGGHGKGGATMAINKSKYRQPRRKTWSVVVDSSQVQLAATDPLLAAGALPPLGALCGRRSSLA